MDYTLHQLRIFLKISKTLSITKAAEALHLTQPAVSIQLKKLQEQFDIPLIEVIGRQVYLTDFGKEIAIASEKILQEVHEIKNRTLAYKGFLVGQLNISIVSTAKYVMPYFLADFLELHSGVELKMDVTNKSKVLHSLENNEVDFALVSVLPEHLQIQRVELMKNKLYLIGARQENKNPKAKNISRETFERTPLIYREQGSATRQAMERYISGHRIPLKKTMELTSNEAVKQAVLAGLGCSIMPLIGLKNSLLNGDLQIIPAEGLPIITHWNLIWLKGKRFNPITEAYLEFVQAKKEAIIHKHFQWYEKY